MNSSSFPDIDDINKAINKVHTICLFGSTNKINIWSALNNKNTLSLFANQNKKLHESNDVKNIKLTQKEIEAVKIYDFYSNRAIQPEGSDQRNKYLMGFVISTQFSSYRYGFGGCEPMADILFLESIFQNFSCDIHYVKFHSLTDNTVEEINTVVLGDNNRHQYIILSPWENAHGAIYYWNGNLSDIYKIYPNYYSFDHAAILFTISKDNIQEKQMVQTMLKQYDYQSWLDDANRKLHLHRVKENFLNCVSKISFFKNDPLRLRFDDYTRLAATNKTNHEIYNNVCLELNTSKEVQQILKLSK